MVVKKLRLESEFREDRAMGSVFKIKVNSGEENKDKRFELLMNSGLSIICLKNEEYVIPERGVGLLEKEKVKFEIVEGNSNNAPKIKN